MMQTLSPSYIVDAYGCIANEPQSQNRREGSSNAACAIALHGEQRQEHSTADPSNCICAQGAASFMSA